VDLIQAQDAIVSGGAFHGKQNAFGRQMRQGGLRNQNLARHPTPARKPPEQVSQRAPAHLRIWKSNDYHDQKLAENRPLDKRGKTGGNRLGGTLPETGSNHNKRCFGALI
jgi:hypothetical protein